MRHSQLRASSICQCSKTSDATLLDCRDSSTIHQIKEDPLWKPLSLPPSSSSNNLSAVLPVIHNSTSHYQTGIWQDLVLTELISVTTLIRTFHLFCACRSSSRNTVTKHDQAVMYQLSASGILKRAMIPHITTQISF